MSIGTSPPRGVYLRPIRQRTTVDHANPSWLGRRPYQMACILAAEGGGLIRL